MDWLTKRGWKYNLPGVGYNRLDVCCTGITVYMTESLALDFRFVALHQGFLVRVYPAVSRNKVEKLRIIMADDA